MKLCPTCKTKYPDDANFCPLETCATADGPQRLQGAAEDAKARYQPAAKLGGGSTGEVWRARDTETGAEVAYKVVLGEVLATPAAIARAEREYKQLMRVQSPKIASVLDCGRTPDDRLYVAMELCQGESLERLLKGGPVPLDRAKVLIAQIGQALLEAQKAGIVHRDVAPKNVIVGPNGDVKVTNFPLAKPLTEKVAGVPAYLSPEQAQGKPVDQRSNTYSLAAILYHLLTGEPPFQGATPQAILDLHVSSPPLPPSQRRPEANLSPDVDRVILKALDKSSSRRHLTLRLFLTEVESLTVPASAPAAAPGGAPRTEVGFAKTMLFAGGQAEVANLVAKAIAARSSPGGAAGASPAAAAPAVTEVPAATAAAPPTVPAHSPPVAPIAPAPITAPQVLPAAAVAPARVTPAQGMPITNGAVVAPPASFAAAPPVAPTTMAIPTPAPVPPPAAAAPPTPLTAAPSAPSAPSTAGAEAGRAAANKQGSAFRETLWFKKGDVDQMVADAKAKIASAGKPPVEAEPGDDVRPLEDRYVDDGTVSVEDRKKFSLRSGGTATALPAVGGTVPGEQMSDTEMVKEIGGSKKTIILIVAAVVVLAIVVAVFMSMRGSGQSAAPAGAVPAAAAAAAAAAAIGAAAVPPPSVPTPPPAMPAAAAAAPAPVKGADREVTAKAAEPTKKKARNKRRRK